MTTSATENVEVVTPATTPTRTQLTRSRSATAVTIMDITARGLRINLSPFGVPQTGVPARISICQVISTFFCENAADSLKRSDSQNSTGRERQRRPDFPIGIPHMENF